MNKIATACLLAMVSALPIPLAQGQQADPAVPAGKPAQPKAADFEDCTGHAVAAQSVTIIPRVSGFVTKVAFMEGAQVKKGEVLFELTEVKSGATELEARASATDYEVELEWCGHAVAASVAPTFLSCKFVAKVLDLVGMKQRAEAARPRY